MSLSVLITNLTAAVVPLNELYIELGASGSATDSTTVTRSMSEMDSMNQLKALMSAGTVSVVPTASSDNAGLMSIPVQQHGVVSGVSVVSTGEILSSVTFPEAFPSGVTPNVMVTVDKTGGTTSRSQAYVQSVTNTGCVIALVITTAEAASTVKLNWTASY